MQIAVRDIPFVGLPIHLSMQDKMVYSNDLNPFSMRAKHYVNNLGRIPLLGNLVGVLRVAYGVVKAAALAFAALVCLCSGNIPYAKFLASESLDGLMHCGRGMMEILTPLINPLLNKYDDIPVQGATNTGIVVLPRDENVSVTISDEEGEL